MIIFMFSLKMTKPERLASYRCGYKKEERGNKFHVGRKLHCYSLFFFNRAPAHGCIEISFHCSVHNMVNYMKSLPKTCLLHEFCEIMIATEGRRIPYVQDLVVP